MLSTIPNQQGNTEAMPAEEQPSAAEEHPSAAEEHPSAAEEQPSAAEEQPSAAEGQPSAAEEQPSAAEEHPSAAEEDPSAAEEDPSAAEEDPSAAEEQPSAAEEELSAEEQYERRTYIRAFSEGEHVNISSLLFTSNRDYLVNNKGDEVTIEALKGKTVGFYFAEASSSDCQRFTPLLIQAYNELAPNANFEIVFISSDDLTDSFDAHFSTMPSSWLAIPFYENFYSLSMRLDVDYTPHLVIFSDDGELLTFQGVQIITDYGSSAFPFSRQKIQAFVQEEKQNQTLYSILATKTRDYLVSSDGRNVPVSDLQGKTVGLYFWSPSSSVFTQTLERVYLQLRESGEDFEIVMIMPPSVSEDSFKNATESAPWPAIPFRDTKLTYLISYFEISFPPALTIIGLDGSTLNPDAVQAVNDYESLAFPFTPRRIKELHEIQAPQTLHSLLVSGDRDFVIQKNGSEIAVSSLEGKTIMLFFSQTWDTNEILYRLKDVYYKLKAEEAEFEVIFVPDDGDESDVKSYFEEKMPWLALPSGDERRVRLREKLKVRELPMVVAIGPCGQTVAKDARKLIERFGAEAYPFTEERVKEIEDEIEEKRKGWPEKLNHKFHRGHELVLTDWGKYQHKWREYQCKWCNENGESWSYICPSCMFELHPACALKKD